MTALHPAPDHCSWLGVKSVLFLDQDEVARSAGQGAGAAGLGGGSSLAADYLVTG